MSAARRFFHAGRLQMMFLPSCKVPSGSRLPSAEAMHSYHSLAPNSSTSFMGLSTNRFMVPSLCRSVGAVRGWKEISTYSKNCFSTNASQDNQASSPQPQPSSSTFDDLEPDMYQQTSSVRRRPYNLEAKMRMKQYRREAMQRQRAFEIEEEERNFQLDHSKLYKKGDPGTMQGIIKEINTVGYFVKLPNGREGFLPCSQFGCSGGIPLLSKLFKVGDEITVRAEIMRDGGKDKLYCKDCEKWA